jgi:glycosyltransferase involved in cell wall biosynthesis
MRRYPHNVSVVFPAKNEGSNIEPCVLVADALLRELVNEYEIIVVDDGSTDRTAELASKLADGNRRVRCIKHDTNVGYGAALRTGFISARYEYLFFSDSDRQFDIFDLKDLLEIAETADIVVGYRRQRQDPLARKVAAVGYNYLVSFLFDVQVKDIDCAFKLFHRRVFDRIEIQSERFFVNTEILAKARICGYRIVQVPVTHLQRTADASKVGFGDITRTLRELIRIRRQIANFRKVVNGQRTAATIL